MTKSKSLEYVVKFAKERLNRTCLSAEYKNNKSKLRWMCDTCHYEWEASFKAMEKELSKCPRCLGRVKYTIDDCKKIARERGGECLSETYQNNKANLLWKCSEGHEWQTPLHTILSNCQGRGSWCPDCNRTSEGERIIHVFLTTHNIEYKFQWQTRKLGKKRFDFYLQELNIMIEYDGLQHFGKRTGWFYENEETFGNRQQSDILKTNFCLQNGIKLARICYNCISKIPLILEDVLETDFDLYLTSHTLYKYLLDNVEPRKLVIKAGKNFKVAKPLIMSGNQQEIPDTTSDSKESEEPGVMT